ncbi:MAG: hypothetical protein ACD_63C00168G0003 [uncultured bacterium]|nr:MAG: hypothetical protein ACD_63C00168G0003 [uncultured bacterium]
MPEIKYVKDIIEHKWLDITNLPKDCATNIKPVLKHFKKYIAQF